jgi:membrane protease YdiL (CAAX protease family)
MGLAVFVAGTLVLTAFVAWATHRSARMLEHTQVDFNLLLLPAENVLRVVLVAACLVLGGVSGLPRDQLGWLSHRPWADLAAGLAAGLLIQLPLDAMTGWAIRRFGPGIYSSKVILSILPRRRDEWLPVLVALFPAVLLEELLFRSLLLGGMSAFLPPAVLVAGTALLFGWMHAPQGRLGMALTAVVSVVLSGLFLWRGSLLTPLVAHYVVNLLQLVVAYPQRDRLR